MPLIASNQSLNEALTHCTRFEVRHARKRGRDVGFRLRQAYGATSWAESGFRPPYHIKRLCGDATPQSLIESESLSAQFCAINLICNAFKVRSSIRPVIDSLSTDWNQLIAFRVSGPTRPSI